ncbi:hypothetical protein SDC9_58326 [bioreactor metagenome]|uniref:Uncharacterized protein n=1 Tax=bioreactor metagenome TaxID=1076179 RepID=A0A644X743_9ZZZZ
MKLRFVYTPKPRQFEYKPRFHNPEEETHLYSDDNTPGKSTRDAYRRYRRSGTKDKSKRNQSILIYLAIILILLYIIFF